MAPMGTRPQPSAAAVHARLAKIGEQRTAVFSSSQHEVGEAAVRRHTNETKIVMSKRTQPASQELSSILTDIGIRLQIVADRCHQKGLAPSVHAGLQEVTHRHCCFHWAA